MPASALLSDDAYLEEEREALPSEEEKDEPLAEDVTYDIGVLPELNGEAEDSMPIDALLGMAKQDAKRVEQATEELKELDEEEQALDDAFLQKLQAAQNEDAAQAGSLAPPSRQQRLPQSSNESIRTAAESVDQLVDTEELFAEDAEGTPAPVVRRSSSKQDSDVISIGSSSEEEEGENPPPPSAPRAHQQSRKTLPPSMMQPPPPSQARLMTQRVLRQLEDDDREASGYASDDADHFEEKDENVFGQIEGDDDVSSNEEDPDTAEFRRMRRQMVKRRAAEIDQDAEDAYFDEHEEDIEEDEDVRPIFSSEEEEAGDSSSSRSQASSNARRKRHRPTATQDEFDDEVSDAELAEDEALAERQQGELEERVPIPRFMKKDAATGEYELDYSGEEEDEDEDEISGSEEAEEADDQAGSDVNNSSEADREDDIAVLAPVSEATHEGNADAVVVRDVEEGSVFAAEPDQAVEIEAILREKADLSKDTMDEVAVGPVQTELERDGIAPDMQPILDMLSEVISGPHVRPIAAVPQSLVGQISVGEEIAGVGGTSESTQLAVEPLPGVADTTMGTVAQDNNTLPSAELSVLAGKDASTLSEDVVKEVVPPDAQDSLTEPSSRMIEELAATPDPPIFIADSTVNQADEASPARSDAVESIASVPSFLPSSLIIPPQPPPSLAMSAMDPLPSAIPFLSTQTTSPEQNSPTANPGLAVAAAQDTEGLPVELAVTGTMIGEEATTDIPQEVEQDDFVQSDSANGRIPSEVVAMDMQHAERASPDLADIPDPAVQRNSRPADIESRQSELLAGGPLDEPIAATEPVSRISAASKLNH